MVEEQFKLGLTVEIEQKGLPELRKLIEKEVQQAISVSAGKIGKETGAAGGGKTRAAPGVSTAALKSAADTITVSAGDLAKKVVRLATAVADLETSTDKNSTIFKASADKIDAAIKKLVGAISGGGPVGPPTGGAGGGGGGGGAGTPADGKKLKAAQRTAAKELERAAAAEKAVSNNLIRFDVNLVQNTKELAALQSDLSVARKSIKSFQGRLKTSEKEVGTRKAEGRGTKTVEKKLGQDKGRLAAAKADENSLREAISIRKKQVAAIERLITTADSHNQALQAAEESVSAVSTSSKVTATQLNAASAVLKKTTTDLSSISSAADNLAAQIGSGASATTDLAKKVRSASEQMSQRGKVISDDNKQSARLRREKTKAAAATAKSATATQENIKATKEDTRQKQKLAKANQKAATRTAILAESKVGTGVKPGKVSRAADKAKAREKTTLDTALAARGTGKAIAQVKQARSEEARQPQQLRESKGPGGKKVTGAPKIDKESGAAERYLAGAEVGVNRLNKAAALFEAKIKSIFPNRPKIMEEVGFKDFKAQITEGAGVGVREKSGQLKLMKGSVEIFEGKVERVGDVLSDLLTKLVSPESTQMKRVESTARFREPAALDMLKGMLAPAREKMDVMKQGTVGGPLAQAGKVMGRLKLTKGQSEEATGFKGDQRQLIMFANRILRNLAKGTDKLTKAGYDPRLTSVGLSEGAATKKAGIETVMKGKQVSELVLPLQARELSQFVPMGAAGMKEQRIAPQFDAGQLIGGEPPAYTTGGMRGLIEKGLVSREQGRELRTAAVEMPESMEDQIPISRAAAEKLAVRSFESVTVTELGSAIQTGVKILEDKIVGKMGEEPVKFELGAAYEAEVKEVREIMVDGVKRYRVSLEKSTLEGMGGKGQTMGGLKGKFVVHEDLGKTEAGDPIEVIIDPKSMAARGDVQDPTYMMASAMSEFTKGTEQEMSVQQAGDVLADEMKIVGGKAGASLQEAIASVTKRMGIKGFTGTQKITGGLIGKGAGKKGVEALTGKLHMRVAQDQVKKEASVKERFWSATDLAAMEMAGMAETVAHFRKSLDEAQHENEDLVQSIIVLTSSFEQQTSLLDKEGIMPVKPTAFAAMPMGAKGMAEAFKGSLVDPEGVQNQAAAMLLPRQGGLHGALRMGPVGKQLGGRGTFETKEGEVSANKLSRSLDKIRELSTAIMVRRGEVDIGESPEAVSEAASMGDEAINAFASSLQERLKADPGDEGAIQEFDDLVAAMAPFIDSIQDAGKYIKYWSGGKAVPRKGEGGGALTGRQYVAAQAVGPDIAAQKRNQVLGMRDLLFRRTTGGAKDKSVPGLGKLFEPENVEDLRDALQLLGVTFDETGKRVKDLYSELYGKREFDPSTQKSKKVGQGAVDKYYGDLAQQVSARNKPPEPMRRSLMQQLGGGRSVGMRGRAFAIPGEVAPQLEEARKALQRLGQTGSDVGQALGAVGEMEKLQGADVLPKDAIVVNRADFDKWVQELVRFEGVDPDVARKNLMEQGVMLHRDPTTGGASMQARKLMLDEGGRVERGAIGVAGTFREGPGLMTKVMAPLSKELSRLRGILKEKGGGKSPEIDKVRKDFSSLSSLIDNLMNVFTSLGMNLDFDGDQIEIHTKKTRDAAGALEQLASGAEAAWGSFNKLVSLTPGTVQGSTLESLDETFRKKMPEGVALKPQTEAQQQANVSGLVSGKLLVGMSTEIHHRFLMAMMAGLEEQDWSGAFRAVLGKLMLNINESLKMKHAGVAGMEKFEPGTMVDLIRTGDTKGLSKAIGKGGKYEKLGEFNKQFIAEQQDQLLALDPSAAGPGGLTEGLKGRGLEDVIPKEGISAENYKGVIKAALKKMNIKNVFKEMNQTLVQGYARSLEESGMSQKDIKAKIKEKLKGKGGKAPAGIPMDEVIGASFKPWLATRKTFQDKMKRTKPAGQLKELKSFLPKELISHVSKVMDIEDIDIDRESLVEATGIEGFAANLRKSLMAVRNRLGDKLEVAKMPAGVAGRYVEGAEGEAGGKGRIQASSKVMDQLTQGLEILSQMEAGTFVGTAAEAMESIRGIEKFLDFISHERVHQLGAGKGASQIASVVGSLASPRGALGKQSEKIKARMIENLPGVRRLAGRVEEYKTKAEEDPEKIRRAKIGGKEERGTATEIAAKLGDQLNTLIAEELLAYAAQGRLEDAVGDLDLGEKAMGFIENRLKELASKDKEVLAVAQAAGRNISSSALEGLMAGLEGEGVGRGGVKGRVGSRQIGGTILPGQTGVDQEAQNNLAALERVVTEASTVPGFKIGQVDPMAAAEGRLALTGAEPIRSRFAEETEQVERVNELISKAGTTGITKDEQKEIEATAKMFKKDKSDEAGWDMYQKAIRQMHAAKATFLINEARGIEAEMEGLFKSGEAGGPKFRSLGEKLNTKIQNVRTFLLETTQKLGTTPNLAMAKGGPTDAAMAAGIVPMEQVFESAVKRARGRGKGPEGEAEAKRFEKSEQVLYGMKDAIEKNISASEQMAVVWEHIKEDPKIATERLEKMADVTSVWAQTFRQMGKTGAADKMKELAKWIKQMANSMATMTDPSLEGMLARLPKGQRQMVGAAPGGAGLVLPMRDQLQAFEIETKAHQKRLQGLIESPQFKKMGLKTDFEPLKTQIIDPKSTKVVQNLEANFKKVGKTIEYSMNQGGVATQRFGRRMKDAFRRVVQWGFATGIVYGTMRAFRSLSSVLTDVQDRVFALKKVMDVTVTDFVRLQDEAVGMAKNYGIAINEVLDGMVVYGQQGLKVNEIMERTKATLMAVNVTTLDSAGATEALTAAHKVFGGEISNSMGFVDAWAKVAAKHAITAKDLADVVKKAGAAAGVAGMNFEDFMGITTAIGVVSRQTGKEIGTSLKFMMRGMRRPVAQKEFASLGIASLTETGDLRPAMDILNDLAGAWHNLTKAQQLSTAQAAAGIRHYNSFIILMNNFDEALTASAHAATSQGFAMRKNQLAMQTLSKQIMVLKETLKGLGLEVGKAIVPTITAATKALSVLLNVASKVPGPMLQIGTLGLAGMLAFHKAADMVVDSLDAMMGYGAEGPKLKKFFGAEGYIGGMGKGVSKAFKGIFGGIGTGLSMMMAKLVDFGPTGMKPTGVFDPKEQGLIVRGLAGMKTSVVALSSSLGVLRMAALGVVGVAAAIAGVLLYKWYQRVTETGQDMADQMHDQIGKARDLTDSYRSQATELSRISLAQKKLASARKLESDDPAMAQAIASGEYKGAALAARDLHKITLQVGKAIAKIDPTSITDITDSGEFVWDMSDGFSALADNAVDAQNAIVAMMEIKVMKAFAEDITEAQGALANWSETWNSMMQRIGMDPIDLSLAGQLKESQGLLQRLADQRRELTERGIDTIGVEEQHIHALEKHLEIQDKIGLSAIKLKEILDQLPTFESFKTFQAVAGKDFWESLQVGAASGEFGARATASSIAFKGMAKGTAAGGLLDYEAAANPAFMIENLIEKGVKPQVFGPGATGGMPTAAGIMPQATGEILVASRAIAEALLKETTAGFAAYAPEERGEAITAAQSLISEVDKASGEAIVKWSNTITGTLESTSAETVAKVISTIDKQEAQILIFRQKNIEAAGRATQRLLTMQFTGAMAGIRDPGAFNIGPGTRRELTAEQRVMESLPMTLQRLVDLQKEMAEIQRQYNEQLGEGNVEEASAQMAKSAGAVKVMDNQLKELVMTLQKEGFEISRALHYNMAIQDLNKTLEEAAITAEDAAKAEERRTQFIKHTSGALAGLTELPSLTFGKSKKDLTGLERLQQRMPGLSKIVKGFDQLIKKRESMLGVLTDVDKKRSTFERAMKDLAASGEKLTGEQIKVRAVQLAKGIDAGDREIIKIMKETGESQVDYLKSQTEIQSSILQILSLQAAEPRDEEDRQRQNKLMRQAIDSAAGTRVQAAARELPARSRRQALYGATGLEYVAPDRRGKKGEPFRIREEIGAGIFGEGPVPQVFKDLVEELKDIKTKIVEASATGDIGPVAANKYQATYLPGDLEKLNAQEEEIVRKLMEISQVRSEYETGLKKELTTYLGANRSAQIKGEIAKSIGRQQRAEIETAKQQLLASKYFNDTQGAILAQMGDANSALQRAAPHLRLSAAAEDFAKSLEDVIDDFKKAEALELDPKRIKSDLEGPFARVGKPGFKTDFETRREEAEAKLGGRATREERKEAHEELAKIEFDEEEARIKKKQDIEIKALKQQQAQAEKFRDIMAEALLSGEYAGEEIEGRMKSIFNTLGYELETAEEASMRGGKLRFKGVPSLQGVKGLISEIKKFAEKKAKLAEYQLLKKAFEEGGMKDVKANTAYLSHMAEKDDKNLDEQTASLREIIDLMQGGELGANLSAALGVLATELSRLRQVQRSENAAAAPESAVAANMRHGGIISGRRMAHGGIVPGPRTSEKDTVPAMLTPGEQVLTERQSEEYQRYMSSTGWEHGGIVPGVGGEQAVPAAAGVAATFSAMASAIAIPSDQLVRELYEFADGVHAIVTRLKRPGGEGMIVGSQTFDIKNGVVEMGDTAVVNKGFRGQGIGTEQLEEVFRTAKAQGIEKIKASELSLSESQRTAYTKAARATGAEVTTAKLDTQIEYDPSTRTYGAQEGYEGRILEVDLKNVEKDIGKGFKKGSQEFLTELKNRMGVVEGVPAINAQTRAEDAASRASVEADMEARMRDRRAPAAPKKGSSIPEVARLEKSLGMAGATPIKTDPKLKAALEATIARDTKPKARMRAAQPARGGQVRSDRLTTAPRGIGAQLEGQPAWVQEEVLGMKAQIDETGDIPGKGPRGKIHPKLTAAFRTLGKILAPLGAGLQGANIGGLAHKAERGMVDQEEIAKELGRELGITGLATAGALAGSFAGPIGTVVGGLGGAGLGMADQYFGTDMTGTAGSYYDKMMGGKMSGGFQKIAESGLTTKGGDWMAEKFGASDSWLANAQLPTWLGGADYGAGATPPAAGAAPADADKLRTQDEWLQKIAKIQTAAPAVTGPPGFEMAGGPGTAGMYLPSQFAPGPKMGPGVPKVTTGTARTDYTGYEGFFPQAQQFKPHKTDLSGPYQPFEGTRSRMDEAGKYKSIIEALSRGDTVYRPSEGGEGVRAGGPGAAQSYIENLRSARERAAGHYGGASNQGVVGDTNAQQLLGVPITSAQPTLSATGKLQQRGTSEIVEREDEARSAGTAGGAGEASQAFAQALENINTTLTTLSQTGLTIPESLTTTIVAGSEAVVKKLDDVTIKSIPAIEIAPASITSLGSTISTATAGAAVGAQQVFDVDELKNELLQPDGAIDTRIIASTEAFEARITQGEAESIELKGLVDINTGEIGTITSETLPGIETDITGLTAADIDLFLKTDGNAVEINSLNAEVTRVAGVTDDTATTVEGFQASIDEVLVTSDQVTTRIAQFEEEFIVISQDVVTAKSESSNALEQTGELQDSLNRFRAELDGKDAQIEATIGVNATSAQKTKDDLENNIKPTITTLQANVQTNRSQIEGLRQRKQDK